MKTPPSLSEIKGILSAQKPDTPVNVGLNGHLPEDTDLKASKRHSAVNIAIIERQSDLFVLFTRRSMTITDPDAWCLPGGRMDKQDLGNPATTALRETNEEVGIQLEKLNLVGTLPACHDRTHSMITPVISTLREPFKTAICYDEVSETAEIPLSSVLDRNNYRIKEAYFGGYHMKYYVFQDQEIKNSLKVYGITAGMLNLFRHTLNNEQGALDWTAEAA